MLIIFIDSFPYYYLDKTCHMKNFGTVKKVTPAVGYSMNCQPALFTGMYPDELNYFCEWTYDPEGRSPFRPFRGLLKMLSPLERFYITDKLAHKLISKVVGYSIKNIPFDYLPYLLRTGREFFSPEFKRGSVLDSYVRLVSPGYSKNPVRKSHDKLVYKAAQVAIENGDKNIILALTELDGIAHWKGVGSAEYDAMVRQLDEWVWSLKEHYQTKINNGKVIVLSDHGMVNVHKSQRIELEKYFGPPSSERYHFFLDGTILRVWVSDNKVGSEIENYLQGLKCGKIYTLNERGRFAFTNKEFADIIFQADEGIMFSPCFWGRKVSKAMHGYHPDLESQKGIYLQDNALSDGNCQSNENFIEDFQALDVFRYLQKLSEKEKELYGV